MRGIVRRGRRRRGGPTPRSELNTIGASYTVSASGSTADTPLLTVGSGGHNLSELDRIHPLPDRTRRGGSTRAFPSLVLVDGTVDCKVQREHLIVHRELEVPIWNLGFQSGRIRDSGLGGAWLRARWSLLERVRRCDSCTIRGLCFDF